MTVPLPTFVLPASPARPQLQSRSALSRRRPRSTHATPEQPSPPCAMQSPPSQQKPDPQPHSPQNDVPAATVVPKSQPSVPDLFNGPEAVLGLVLAASALLIDFAKHLAALLSSAPSPEAVTRDLRGLDASIDALHSAVDASKIAISKSEQLVDQSVAATTALQNEIASMAASPEGEADAKRKADDLEAQLVSLRDALKGQQARLEEANTAVANARLQRSQSEQAVVNRTSEVSEVRDSIAAVRNAEKQRLVELSEEEARFRELIVENGRKVAEGKEALRENEQKLELATARLRSIDDEITKAEDELAKVSEKVDGAKSVLEKAKEERRVVDMACSAAIEKKRQANEILATLPDMEVQLARMREHLIQKEKSMEEVSSESENLKSLLAARDAELTELSSRLESALIAQAENGGDKDQTAMSLHEISENLKAEQMALSAEIRKAELTQLDVTNKELDPLQRLDIEMDAEGSLLQAGLRKAETAIGRVEEKERRKKSAVADVLGIVQGEASSISTEASRLDSHTAE